MAFDPVAYLKEKRAAQAPVSQQPVAQPGAFDPEAYLTAKRQAAPAQAPGMLESFGRGGLQGGTLGFADEISGVVESAAGSFGLTDVDKTYQQARDESRANFAAAEAENPMTSLAGNLAGSMLLPGAAGLGTAGKVLSKIPGIGSALAGSTIAKAGALGAGLGGVEGVGRSNEETVRGLAGDAGAGAALGGVGNLAAGVLFKGMGAAASAGGSFLRQSFEPTLQRLKAFGATAASIRKYGGVEAVSGGMDELVARGGVEGLKGDNIPGLAFQRIDSIMDGIAAEMKGAVAGQQGSKVPGRLLVDEFLNPLITKLQGEALTADREAGEKVLNQLFNDVTEAGGSLEKLHRLKKQFGAEVSWSERPLSLDPQIKTKLYKEATTQLNELIINHMNRSSDDIGGMAGEKLRNANASYSKLSKLWPLMKETADTFATEGDRGATLRIKDQLTGAGAFSAVGALTGIPGMGVAGGAASLVGGAALRSVPGRLARAKIGESMGISRLGQAAKAASDAAAAQQGMIPRTLDGVRSWLKQYPNLVPPSLTTTVKDIMTLPDAAAEIQVRTLLPLFAQFVAPSPYKSEFNGKISSPQDRVTARQVIMAQGLPPSVASYHQSMLSKSGTLQGYHHAPAQPEGDYGDKLLQFNERLTAQGY